MPTLVVPRPTVPAVPLTAALCGCCPCGRPCAACGRDLCGYVYAYLSGTMCAAAGVTKPGPHLLTYWGYHDVISDMTGGVGAGWMTGDYIGDPPSTVRIIFQCRDVGGVPGWWLTIGAWLNATLLFGTAVPGGGSSCEPLAVTFGSFVSYNQTPTYPGGQWQYECGAVSDMTATVVMLGTPL